ncbi:MAG: glycosyltransferase family 2 protein, partial [Vulcanimicrobiaceae bacterium]
HALEASQVVPPAQEPLVSIVIPTYNRRARVESAVQRLCVQQYPDIEIVVVNDGGENVDHLVDFDPRVRVIDAKANAGPAAAVNIGLREANGKYVEWVADDDLLYPDHVLRCVAALERTGAVVAHSNALLCASLVNEDGIDTAIYDTDRFSETADLCETYAYHRVARFLVRRTEIVELGGLAEDLFACDLEILIRLAERFDFVHVPVFTSETWLRMGEVQFSTRKDLDHATELEKMFERHPASGRPYVAALRKKTLANVRGKAGSVRGY